MSDQLLKNKIRHYLDNHPFFNFSKIKIFVAKGEVSLTGTVLTANEKNFAESIVKQMHGVNKFKSEIKLLTEAVTLRLPKLQALLART